MKIQDAKVGDVLRGRAGTLWEVDEHGASVRFSEDGPIRGRWPKPWEGRDDPERHGPFVRHVSEKESDR